MLLFTIIKMVHLVGHLLASITLKVMSIHNHMVIISWNNIKIATTSILPLRSWEKSKQKSREKKIEVKTKAFRRE